MYDRQTEPRAASDARIGGACLHERLENALELVGWNAATGVRHREHDAVGIVALLRQLELHGSRVR